MDDKDTIEQINNIIRNIKANKSIILIPNIDQDLTNRNIYNIML